MSMEAALEANTAATLINNGLLERLLAGQDAALAKIEQPKAAPKKTEPKPEPAAVKEDPKPAAVAKEPEAPAAVVGDADVKAAALAWMDGKSKEDRIAASAKLTELLAFFGTDGKLTGPESKLDDDQRKQAKFFIERWAAGLTVDFNADYDFDGAPVQSIEEEADPLG